MKFIGLSLIEKLEGCKLNAYRDQAGVWTIGHGHTGGVRPGDVWTEEQAAAHLAADLGRFDAGVRKLVEPVELNDAQFSALVIFAFNVGLTALQGSTALRLLKNYHFEQVPAALALWDKVHDKSGVPIVNEGLVHRRAAEAALWNTPDAPAGAIGETP